MITCLPRLPRKINIDGALTSVVGRCRQIKAVGCPEFREDPHSERILRARLEISGIVLRDSLVGMAVIFAVVPFDRIYHHGVRRVRAWRFPRKSDPFYALAVHHQVRHFLCIL